MFGFDFFIVNAVNTLKAYQEEARRFDELCKSLPQEQADQLKAERKKQREENLQHMRNIEVAREGRSKNFWGSR